MANIYLGSTDLGTADLKLGSTAVSAAYLGSTKVWPAVTAWTPASIAKYWWTADAGVTTVSGGVSSWEDQVTGLTLTQGTAGNRPTVSTQAALGGETVIRFDGSNDYLQRSPLSFSSTGYSFTNYVIFYNASTAQGSTLAQSRFGAGAGRYSIISYSNAHRIIPPNFANTDNIALQNPVQVGAKVSGMMYDNAVGGPETTFWFNNLTTAVATRTDGNSDQDIFQNSSLLIGAYNGSSGFSVANGYYFNGDVAEVIWVEGTMDSTDRADLKSYINTKYSLSIG